MIPEDEIIDIVTVKPVTAWQFLLSMRPALPRSTQAKTNITPDGSASNAEVRRWLENKAVIINGEKPGPQDIIKFPVTQLVFFPKGDRRTTVI